MASRTWAPCHSSPDDYTSLDSVHNSCGTCGGDLRRPNPRRLVGPTWASSAAVELLTADEANEIAHALKRSIHA